MLPERRTSCQIFSLAVEETRLTTMTDNVTSAIYKEAQKLVVRHQTYSHRLSESLKRRAVRSGTNLSANKVIKTPAYWACDQGFDPYHVRKHYKSIAHSIKKSLDSGTYVPKAAVIHKIPKAGGRFRQLSVFQIADQAISRTIFDRLMAKNSSRLNPKCYAYRKDKTVHDAVLNVAYDLKGVQRIYLAEYDFREFFASIDHSQIKRLLSDRRFYLTNREMKIVMGFLEAPKLPVNAYDGSSSQHSTRGIPLGTSISLFVANIVTYSIAEQLEKLGVGFAFYSDDSIVWSDSYEKISQGAKVISSVAADMGLSINFSKSEGIRLLTPAEAPRELAGKDSVSFIGHKIDTEHISMRDSLVSKVKEKLTHLIFSNLLQEPLRGRVNRARLIGFDRDYQVLISLIRRYLYGDLREEQVRRYLARTVPKIHYRGFMSFFPVVDDDELLKSLDAWLVSQIYLALRRRAKLLRKLGVSAFYDPHNSKRADLVNLKIGNIDLSIPSFLRMSKLLRRAVRAHGANAIANPKSAYYYSA